MSSKSLVKTGAALHYVSVNQCCACTNGSCIDTNEYMYFNTPRPHEQVCVVQVSSKPNIQVFFIMMIRKLTYEWWQYMNGDNNPVLYLYMHIFIWTRNTFTSTSAHCCPLFILNWIGFPSSFACVSVYWRNDIQPRALVIV